MAEITDIGPPRWSREAPEENPWGEARPVLRVDLSVHLTRRDAALDLVLLWPSQAARCSVAVLNGGRPRVVAYSEAGRVRWIPTDAEVGSAEEHLAVVVTVEGLRVPPQQGAPGAPPLAVGVVNRSSAEDLRLHYVATEQEPATWAVGTGIPSDGLPVRGRPLPATRFGLPADWTGARVRLPQFGTAERASSPYDLDTKSTKTVPAPPLPYSPEGLPQPPMGPDELFHSRHPGSGGASPAAPFHRPQAQEPSLADATPVAAQQPPRGQGQAQQPVVSTGFSEQVFGVSSLSVDTVLRPDQPYWFWLQIGAPHPDSIERTPRSLPSNITIGARLTVVLSGVSEGALVDAANEADLCLVSDGALPARRADPRLGQAPGDRRVLIGVRTPSVTGPAQWRCLIYWDGALVQSRLVTALVSTVEVGTVEASTLPALESVVEYSIADPADGATLGDVGTHDGSIVVVPSDDGATHTLLVRARDFVGVPTLRAALTLDEGVIAQATVRARAALRTVAWGDAEPWDPRGSARQRYRFEEQPDLARLTADLTRLAVAGYRLHLTLAQEFARASGLAVLDARDRLADALRDAGTVQVAMLSARHVLPAALLYDLPLDTGAPTVDLCPDFAAAYLAGPKEAAQAPCFKSRCTQARAPRLSVVCPGGFWGFRHSLGMPLSTGANRSVPAMLRVDENLRLDVALYSGFPSADRHVAALRQLRPGAVVSEARSRDDLDSLLRRSPAPHLLYFYCHGGLTSTGLPFLRLGDERTDEVLTPDNLYAWRVHWSEPRPLVFLNGCRTTDLEPERLLDFASSFVTDAGASGLLGTEITVFEEMAGAFAEEYLCLFLAGHPAGEAVLRARRALLSWGNPLGLAYVPFLPPHLQVEFASEFVRRSASV